MTSPTATTPVPRRTLENFFLGQPLVDRNATPNITYRRNPITDTYTQTWNFHRPATVRRHNLAVEAGYVGIRALERSTRPTTMCRMPGPGNIQAPRPYPNWGVLDYKIWGGGSTYHSFQAKLDKRFSNGFSFLGSYTWSKCLDGPGSEEGTSPVYTLDSLNKGRVRFDVPHNFVTSYIWELPFGRADATCRMLRRWSIS